MRPFQVESGRTKLCSRRLCSPERDGGAVSARTRAGNPAPVGVDQDANPTRPVQIVWERPVD
jgi:hypothetical protein